MSIELPEAKIFAEQMNRELKGKRIKSHHIRDCERLQRIGMMNKDTRDFEQLNNRRIESVQSRGNVILVKLDKQTNLILGPEYGGEAFYHKNGKVAPDKFHLKLDFDDDTSLTVRLTSMGIIEVRKDENLERSYVYKRDFNPNVPSPADKEFTLERFSKLLKENNRALKSVLVGKDAVVVGLSNSAFQDILYRAKIHPQTKASELSNDQQQALYNAVRHVVQERIRLGGKNQFLDLYGKQGRYTPAMGSHMKDQNCPLCKTPIEKLNIGGGQTYYCPKCQK